jgi:hypothetical protein
MAGDESKEWGERSGEHDLRLGRRFDCRIAELQLIDVTREFIDKTLESRIEAAIKRKRWQRQVGRITGPTAAALKRELGGGNSLPLVVSWMGVSFEKVDT